MTFFMGPLAHRPVLLLHSGGRGRGTLLYMSHDAWHAMLVAQACGTHMQSTARAQMVKVQHCT